MGALCLAGAMAAVALGAPKEHPAPTKHSATKEHSAKHAKQGRQSHHHHKTRGAAAGRHVCRRRSHKHKHRHCQISPKHRSVSGAEQALGAPAASGSLSSLPAPGNPSAPGTGVDQQGAPTPPSGEAPPAEGGAGGGSAPQGPAHVQVSAKEFSLTLSRPNATAGPIVVELVNAGQDEHNLHIRPAGGGPDVGAVGIVLPGHHSDVEFHLAPGSYTFYCALPAHEALGMKATFTVQ